MNDYVTVMMAAGESDDMFINSGFPFPRNLTPFRGKTIIEWALDSYCSNQMESIVVLRANEESKWKTSNIIRRKLENCEIYLSKNELKGSLIAALIALEKVNHSSAILIAPADSKVRLDIDDIFTHSASSDIAFTYFKSNLPRYSYALLDKENNLIDIAEKRVISENALTGMMIFKSKDVLMKSAEWALLNNVTYQNSFYLSSAVLGALALGFSVKGVDVSKSGFQSLSTPIDLFEESK